MNNYLFPDRYQYQLVTGTEIDRPSLLKFLQITYQELYPQQQNYHHLQFTVDRYFSTETPLWFVTTPDQNRPVQIACLWVGIAIEQISGVRHPNMSIPITAVKGLGERYCNILKIGQRIKTILRLDYKYLLPINLRSSYTTN